MPEAAKSKLSVRERVAAAADIPHEMVAVPEWDGVQFEMRGMSAGRRGLFLDAMVQPDGNLKPDFKRYYADLVIYTAYDPETGQLAFEPSDADMLNEKAAVVIERLGAISLRLSGLSEGSVESGKEGSSSTRNGDSSSN